MALFDILRPKGTLTGELVLAEMPECKMLSATVHFFPARSVSDPFPYGGNPPPSAYRGEISVREAEDPARKDWRHFLTIWLLPIRSFVIVSIITRNSVWTITP